MSSRGRNTSVMKVSAIAERQRKHIVQVGCSLILLKVVNCSILGRILDKMSARHKVFNR